MENVSINMTVSLPKLPAMGLNAEFDLSTLLFTVFAISCSLLIFQNLSPFRRYKNEPTYISPKVPVIGHIMGLAKRRYCYYVNLYKKYNLEIFSLIFPGMPRNRCYIVNSPELIVAIQRMPMKISFWHVEAIFTGTLAGLSPYANNRMKENIEADESRPAYLRDGMTNVHEAMKPGPGLTNVSREAADRLAPLIGKLEQNGTTRVELGSWVTCQLISSITGSIFGPLNPFKDPEVVQAFDDFQSNAAGLLSYPFPKYTCPKAYYGREKLSKAFEKFYAAGGNDTASHWVQGATKISESHGISDEDIARIDCSNSHAILSNTTPSAFWAVYHVFADPEVLAEVRTAMIPLLTTTEKNGIKHHEVDISQIRELPILKSILHEALRHYASGTGTRVVVEDIILDNKYLLKKDTFVFMPNRSFHFNPSVWGEAVDEFDAHRFMKTKGYRGAFRAFGGGANLCPGRLFAMNSILAMCAMLAIRYDIKPVGRFWMHPGTDDSNMTLNVHPPKEKVEVEIVPRRGWTGAEWSFKV